MSKGGGARPPPPPTDDPTPPPPPPPPPTPARRPLWPPCPADALDVDVEGGAAATIHPGDDRAPRRVPHHVRVALVARGGACGHAIRLPLCKHWQRGGRQDQQSK